jgi:hypothetical protein
MASLFFDRVMPDTQRRRGLFGGDLFVYSPGPATTKLIEFAREMLTAAFAPHDPRFVERHLAIETCAAVLSKLKPAFIHHPECKRLLPQIIAEQGGDPERTYFDVPRLRSAYPVGYLSSGIAYAFHPHRDTWYSAPQCQINWWLPIYEIETDNCLAFHPRYFGRPTRNSSDRYNYYAWNRTSRAEAARHVRSDTREQPKLLEEIEREEIRILCPPGGTILFSGAHLHETVPNTSGVARYSIDFRTVHLDDLLNRDGAPNADSRCTGTTMRDYLRCTDLAPLPAEVVQAYDDGSEAEANDALVFTADMALRPST